MTGPQRAAVRLTVDVPCAGETLTLMPERVALWPRTRMLLLADWHLGKAGVFGRRGLAIPDGGIVEELARLDTVLAAHEVTRILVLGDLMHAPPVAADVWPDQLAAWLDGYSQLQFGVVAGNHDRVSAKQLPAALAARIEWRAEPLAESPFVFDHEPEPCEAGFVIAGHLHPTRRLRLAGDSLRTPVFWLRHDHAVLPAFGSFTGGSNIRPTGDDRVFAVGPDAVVDISRR